MPYHNLANYEYGRNLVSMSGIDFVHPEDLGTDVKDLICVECHARK
jgi:hypothetical protein